MLKGIRGQHVDALTSAGHLGLLIVALYAHDRAVWMGCLTLIAIISLVAWASNYRRVRAIADIPTSRIASAAQGYVELSGRASVDHDYMLVSPLSGISCIWFRYWVYTKSGKGEWSQTSNGVSNQTFEIGDGTGQCVIDPDDAEIVAADRRVSYHGNYKHVEELLYGGVAIYVLGEFSTFGGASTALNLKEDVGELLAAWKGNPAALRERFDLDKNGEIDQREWELARRAAVREVQAEHREIRTQSDVNVLRAPRDGGMFLISSLSPQKLRFKYLLWSGLHLLIFLCAASAALWLWHGHHLQEFLA